MINDTNKDIDEVTKHTKQYMHKVMEEGIFRVPLIVDLQVEILKLLYINKLNPAERQFLLQQLYNFELMQEMKILLK